MMKMKVLAVACIMALSAQAQEKERTAYMVSDAHLDTQWNWDVQTTIKSHIWNTMVQNFMLFRQYPDYIFNFEGGVKYAWMKEYYPAQYEELKKWIGLGRWHITGSSWDANEVILCSPESWIRNVLLGQTFYRQEFGKEGTDVFLPDCFGFPYTMPTLAKHCGLIGFSSQKLAWRTVPFYEDGKRYPFTVGLWQGIDGNRIMMTHGFGYGQRYNDEDLSKNKNLLREVDESPLGIAYRYYGTGDIGGSPTINSVRALEKGLKGDGPVKIISATSDQLYKDYLPYDQHPELPVFDGELTMDLHGNGCYTSQAAMKLYNRQNEHLGDAAERAAVMADWAGAYQYPIGLMTESWRRMIWHQFHDDLTGTSIPRAYEFSWNDELLSLKQFSDVLTTSVGGMVRLMDTNVSGTPIIIYNNEAFPVKGVTCVQLADDRNYTVTDGNGKQVKAQVTENRKLLFEASVPATGFAVYSIKAGGKNKTAFRFLWYNKILRESGYGLSAVPLRCMKERSDFMAQTYAPQQKKGTGPTAQAKQDQKSLSSQVSMDAMRSMNDASGAGDAGNPEGISDALGGGRRINLSDAMQSKMEKAFGLDISGVNTVSNGASVSLYQHDDGNDQKWIIVPVGSSGNYNIRNAANRNVSLAVKGSEVCVQTNSTYAPVQRWNMANLLTEDAYVGSVAQASALELIPKSDMKKRVTVSVTDRLFGIANAGTVSLQTSASDGANQRWQLAPVGTDDLDGVPTVFYRITEAGCNLALEVQGDVVSGAAVSAQYVKSGSYGSGQYWYLMEAASSEEATAPWC